MASSHDPGLGCGLPEPHTGGRVRACGVVRTRAERLLSTQHAVTEILAEAASLEEATPLIVRAISEGIGADMGMAEDPDFVESMAALSSQIGQFVDRIEAEAALRSTREQLAHVTRVVALDGIATSIAHEINQPLTGIVANAEAARRWLGQSPPQLQEALAALERLSRDGKRAGEVVIRLRALVRKAEPTAKSNVDVNAVIRETFSLLRSETAHSGVEVELDLAQDLPAVRADRVQLQQVVLNLLINALEALAEQHDRPRRLAVESRDHDSGRIVIRVIDNGAGLPPEHTARIFAPFFTTKRQGLGMGLAISRTLVEDHGGRLSVHSNDSGSTFEFTLPKAVAR